MTFRWVSYTSARRAAIKGLYRKSEDTRWERDILRGFAERRRLWQDVADIFAEAKSGLEAKRYV